MQRRPDLTSGEEAGSPSPGEREKTVAPFRPSVPKCAPSPREGGTSLGGNWGGRGRKKKKRYWSTYELAFIGRRREEVVASFKRGPQCRHLPGGEKKKQRMNIDVERKPSSVSERALCPVLGGEKREGGTRIFLIFAKKETAQATRLPCLQEETREIRFSQKNGKKGEKRRGNSELRSIGTTAEGKSCSA